MIAYHQAFCHGIQISQIAVSFIPLTVGQGLGRGKTVGALEKASRDRQPHFPAGIKVFPTSPQFHVVSGCASHQFLTDHEQMNEGRERANPRRPPWTASIAVLRVRRQIWWRKFG